MKVHGFFFRLTSSKVVFFGGGVVCLGPVIEEERFGPMPWDRFIRGIAMMVCYMEGSKQCGRSG